MACGVSETSFERLSGQRRSAIRLTRKKNTVPQVTFLTSHRPERGGRLLVRGLGMFHGVKGEHLPSISGYESNESV
jgi:hypothetical protein